MDHDVRENDEFDASKHMTVSKCQLSGGPASYTLDQHGINIGSMSKSCWLGSTEET